MKVNELRGIFLEYYKEKQHKIIPSSSLVPINDSSLLFTNAGMVQFKEVFLGIEKRSYKRATSVQRCVRASGKHNDLEEVGFTARHHTFFEMLGNFSFGDYFKQEAIQFAWEFLTKILKLSPEKLWVTVYKDDKEAANIWLNKTDISSKQISYLGEKDNFWMMGETGPCGPCSEIFYDHGENFSGGPPGSANENGDRYVEFWNLVFMQYNRDVSGKLIPLPKPSVDTGMGLERVAAIMQGVHDNYEIDLFHDLLTATQSIVGSKDIVSPSLRVIADHIRSCSFLIADGVIPSNEGRGYVLRRIIRRGIRHGNKLGVKKPFFNLLVSPLIDIMGEAYPILMEKQKIIEQTLLQEEERFAVTLDQGLKVFHQVVGNLSGKEIPGETVFKLYDTYGFPADLTNVIAKELDYDVDMPGFYNALKKQQSQSKSNTKFCSSSFKNLEEYKKTNFVGYECLVISANVIGLFVDFNSVNSINGGENAAIILDQTPFYAEAGGQVGDSGVLEFQSGIFDIKNTIKQGDIFLHEGRLREGVLSVGSQVTAQVDSKRRQKITSNHSATHLLHAALRKILGSHIEQKGSLVSENHLRFDFSHSKIVNEIELNSIEDLVNQYIRSNYNVIANNMSLEEANEKRAIALFGEKYNERVRVLSIGDISTELCGGTHVKRSGDIGLFKIIIETGVAAGIRRLEALSGENALLYVRDQERLLQSMCGILKTTKSSLFDKLSNKLKNIYEMEKQISKLKTQLQLQQAIRLLDKVQKIKDIKLLVSHVDNVDIKGLREILDYCRNKLDSFVILLASIQTNGYVNFVSSVSKSICDHYCADKLLQYVAKQLGGRGGGNSEMAQGGAKQSNNLEEVLNTALTWVNEVSRQI